jgi:hypothetical protein
MIIKRFSARSADYIGRWGKCELSRKNRLVMARACP